MQINIIIDNVTATNAVETAAALLKLTDRYQDEEIGMLEFTAMNREAWSDIWAIESATPGFKDEVSAEITRLYDARRAV